MGFSCHLASLVGQRRARVSGWRSPRAAAGSYCVQASEGEILRHSSSSWPHCFQFNEQSPARSRPHTCHTNDAFMWKNTYLHSIHVYMCTILMQSRAAQTVLERPKLWSMTSSYGSNLWPWLWQIRSTDPSLLSKLSKSTHPSPSFYLPLSAPHPCYMNRHRGRCICSEVHLKSR